MQPVELSLEQRFKIQAFKTSVDRMSREQAQETLIKLYEQMLIRETLWRDLFKQDRGLT